jgi:glycosyltransferase involved in cell wall biosynthesis
MRVAGELARRIGVKYAVFAGEYGEQARRLHEEIKKPMRLVYLSPVGVLGGAERCLLQVMAAMHRQEPDSRIALVAGSPGELLERAQAAGIEVCLLPMPAEMAQFGENVLHRKHGPLSLARLGMRGLSVLPAVRRYCVTLARTVRNLQGDLIHSNGLKMHLLAAIANLPAHKTVWHLHDFLGARPAMGRALRWASRRAAGAIAISQAIARDAHTVLPRLRLQVVYNAIDVDHFRPTVVDPSLLDTLAGMAPPSAGTLRVGLIATFARWKGQDLLLQAAARLLAQKPDRPVRFYIIGGPIYQTDGSQFSLRELREMAVRLGVAQHTGFVEFQSDPRDAFCALDIVVHASTSPEPFGLTIAEAMACGRPVIVAQAGGAAELFVSGVDAVGVTPGDAEALARAIGELAGDPGRRAALGTSARASAAQRFCHQRLGPHWAEVYRRFLSAEAPRNNGVVEARLASGTAQWEKINPFPTCD